MGAPVPDIEAAGDSTAEALLSDFKTIAAAEKRRHANVFNYWQSIRGGRQFPPIRDLDPLEISDAGPCSLLLEMIGGGEDAEIRHIGHAVKPDGEMLRISEAPVPSLLSCIANKLPIVAATKQAFAFEEEFAGPDGATRCWVTLLPFSATGTWIDYVYGFVSLDPSPFAQVEAIVPEPETEEAPPGPVVEPAAEEPAEAELGPEPEPEVCEEKADVVPQDLAEPEPLVDADAPAAATPVRPGFSASFMESLANIGGFYGRTAEAKAGAVTIEPDEPPQAEQPLAEQPQAEQPQAEQPKKPNLTSEGSLESKLDDVRAKADEARLAKLRSNAALYEGLSAAYDFALDAEHEPEVYIKLVEAQGLKIQLRSPMAPVARLAFEGMCDDATIGQLEAVLAWALKMDLPRGSLAERIESEGGLVAILNGKNGGA